MTNWIQNWFNNQCDGNWEHNQVIKIETLDNPGWNVEIDFNYTDVEVENIDWTLLENSDNNWLGYKITNNVFICSGDPLKLKIILKLFKHMIKNKCIKKEYIENLILKLGY